MNLILVHPFLHQRGGGERVVLEISKKFNPIIYTVLYDPKNTFEDFNEYDIRILPKSLLEAPFFFMKNDFRYSRAISAGFRYYFSKLTEDYDVINAHGTPSEWIRNRNERVLWYCYSPSREAYDLYDFRMKNLSLPQKVLKSVFISGFRLTEESIVQKLEKIVAISEITNFRIKKYFKRNDAEVIPPGVDAEKFTNKGYEKYFFYPSRIVPEKRFEYAIEAFKRFSKKKKGWKLIIAGFLADKPSEKEYFEKIKELAKGFNVEFRLNLEEKDLKELYSNSYAVLFTPINEDFGLVPLEAMASEKPCISVNEGGPVNVIKEGRTGFLVNSPEEMADRMLYLASHSEENERMGKEGRKEIFRNYTWKVFLNRMERAFKEVARAKEG
ncbi:MAG: glycosyltransferase family 4 protein [Candidatus Anstonellales archaeon]